MIVLLTSNVSLQVERAHYSFTFLSPIFMVGQSSALFSAITYKSSSEMKNLDRTEAKHLMINRLTHIQYLAKQKKFDLTQALIDRNYV